MKRIALRRDAVCVGCGVELVAGVSAWWDAAQRTVTCASCEGVKVDLPVERQADEAVALRDEDRGVPGASARAERVRRSARREERVQAKHPRLGRLMLAVTDDPTSTKVWDQGAVGEERIGALLEAARARGIEVLHDRRIPRTKANIDHLVIAPGGVWVVDAKRYLRGKLERRMVGGMLSAEARLFIGGRDKSALIDGALKQVDHVVAALAAHQLEAVPVRGALCFLDTEIGLFAKPFSIRSVSVTWPKRMIAPMLTPATFDDAARATIARVLADHFPPA